MFLGRNYGNNSKKKSLKELGEEKIEGFGKKKIQIVVSTSNQIEKEGKHSKIFKATFVPIISNCRY